MKVSELEGASLDYLVARAIRSIYVEGWPHLPTRPYSTEWQHGGPIIEREKMYLGPTHLGRDESGRYKYDGNWAAAYTDPAHWKSNELCMEGLTPLIAAMRCFVASKYGTEVPDVIPDEGYTEKE